MQHSGAKHEFLLHIEERVQCGPSLARPGGQRRARRVHARAGVDRLLPVVRNVVDEAAHQRVGDEPGSGHALVDHLRLDRRLHQDLAAPARPFAAHVMVDEELGRHDVELLGDVLADAHHGLAATRGWAGGALGFVLVLDAPQVLGQRLATWWALGLLVVGVCCLVAGLAQQGCELGLQTRLIFGKRLLEQMPLLGAHAFGLRFEFPCF